MSELRTTSEYGPNSYVRYVEYYYHGYLHHGIM